MIYSVRSRYHHHSASKARIIKLVYTRKSADSQPFFLHWVLKKTGNGANNFYWFSQPQAEKSKRRNENVKTLLKLQRFIFLQKSFKLGWKISRLWHGDGSWVCQSMRLWIYHRPCHADGHNSTWFFVGNSSLSFFIFKYWSTASIHRWEQKENAWGLLFIFVLKLKIIIDSTRILYWCLLCLFLSSCSRCTKTSNEIRTLYLSIAQLELVWCVSWH